MNQDEIEAARRVLYEAGLAKRREVLGDEWVDAALANQSDFDADFQQLITRSAWQEIWLRDGLDDKSRRLITLAITASNGRWGEFRLHVKSALQQNALTESELKELLLQVAVYAGAPTANTAFKEARSVLEEIDGS